MGIENSGVKGFYVDTVGRNKKEDVVAEQMTLEEYIDHSQEKKQEANERRRTRRPLKG